LSTAPIKGIFVHPAELDEQKGELPSHYRSFETVKELLNIPNFPLITLSVMQEGGGAETHNHPHDLAYFVVSGNARIKIGDDERIVGPGGLAYIPPNVPHSNTNASKEPCVILGIHGPHDPEFDKSYYGESHVIAFTRK
jgi:quercetin dioxygenase-like cupin family protein